VFGWDFILLSSGWRLPGLLSGFSLWCEKVYDYREGGETESFQAQHSLSGFLLPDSASLSLSELEWVTLTRMWLIIVIDAVVL
jgi:hypothetical protein